jgi:glycosyltransferase involved in cell wall biosynthesis
MTSWKDIQGWHGCHGLYERVVKEAKDGATFVEIGTWKGRSAAHMASLIEASGKNIRFITIDTFKGSPGEKAHADDPDLKAGKLKEVAMKNLEPFTKLEVFESDSVEAAKSFADKSIDFVFIDAAHEYANVKADIEAWLPKLKDGGVLAGDDFEWEGMRKAVKEAFPDNHWICGRGWIHSTDKGLARRLGAMTGLVFMIPAFGGNVHGPFCLSLQKTSQTLAENGVPHKVVMLFNESDICRARNTLVTNYLGHYYAEASHFMFIDADLEWEPHEIMRLINADKDVVAGVYPHKKREITWPAYVLPKAEWDKDLGVVVAHNIPTGFMMIKGHVFMDMMPSLEDFVYHNASGISEKHAHLNRQWFRNYVIKETKSYQSEDYGFVRQFQQLGGKCWVSPKIKLRHYGIVPFEGDFEAALIDHAKNTDTLHQALQEVGISQGIFEKNVLVRE